MESPSTDMNAIWRGFLRTIFWSYERGSWPYDLAVVVIVIFVLATPARWFHDQPQARPGSAGAVEVVAEDASTKTATYRVDATALAADKRANHPTPELERELHRILGSSVSELKDQPFEVLRINPRTASDGAVGSYDVMVRR